VLNYELNSALFFSLGLRTYIEANKGNLEQVQLSSWLTELQVRGKHIRNIGLAPGNRITYIYPLKGNEAAIGLYYPDEPAQWPGVKEVIETRKPKLIGPFNLKQGGKGLVYREAIFLTTGEYWGIVSTVIDADSLFSTLVARGNELGVRLKIRDLESNNLLLSSTPGSAEIKSEIALNLPGRQWELIGGADSRINTHWVLMRVLGWILAFVITFLWVRYLLSNREKEFAQQLLRESQTRLRRAFSASSQGMALVNQQGDWLDVNQSMTSMLGMIADALKKMPVPSIFTAE
jgi:sensor domain CHASE-containing protein